MSSVAIRLAGFAAALVVAFGGAYAVGSAVGPFDDSADTKAPATSVTRERSDLSDHGDGHGG